MKIDLQLEPRALTAKLERLWALSAQKIRSLEKSTHQGEGAPVFTVAGRYTARGWTEWTQGFQVGASILQFDATGEAEFLTLGRKHTVEVMASHVSHTGVHDHGFNNVSTYGNLLRLILEGKVTSSQPELDYTEMALKASGAVQAARYVTTAYRQPWSPLRTAGSAEGVVPG